MLSTRPAVPVLALSIILTSCSSSTEPIDPGAGPDPTTVTGQVLLPPELGTDPTAYTVVTGSSTVPVNSDGSFSTQVEGEGSSLLILTDATGNAVLLGYGDPLGKAPNQISLHETAVAILFFALESWGLPAPEAESILAQIRAHEVTATLATAVQQELANSAAALATDPSPLKPAIEAAVAELRGNEKAQPNAANPKAGGANSNLLAIPTTPQSGVLVGPNPQAGGIGLQITNQVRRNLWYYAYKVGYEDEDGNAFDVDPPEAIRDGFLTGTSGLQSTSATLIDWAAGNLNFFDKSLQNPINLAVDDGESKAFFDVIVAGAHLPLVSDVPAWYHSSDNLHQEWRTSANQMTALTFVKDVLLPIIFGIVRPIQTLPVNFDIPTVVSLVETIAATVPAAGQQITEGDYLGASFTVIRNLPNNTDLRFAMGGAVAQFLGNNTNFNVQAALGVLETVNLAVIIVDIGLQGLDSYWVTRDIADAEMMERWDVTATPVTLLLDASRPVLNENAPDTRITARVPGYAENAPFCFKWTIYGDGELSDFAGQDISGDGASMITDEREVLYSIDPGSIEEGELAFIECVAYFPVSGQPCSTDGGQAGEGSIEILGEFGACDISVNASRDAIYNDQLYVGVGVRGCTDATDACFRYSLSGPGCLLLSPDNTCPEEPVKELITSSRNIVYAINSIEDGAAGTIVVEYLDETCANVSGSTNAGVASIVIEQKDEPWEDPCLENSPVPAYAERERGDLVAMASGTIGFEVQVSVSFPNPDNQSRSILVTVPQTGPFSRDDVRLTNDATVGSFGSPEITIFDIGIDQEWPRVFLPGRRIEVRTTGSSFTLSVPTDPYRNFNGEVTPCGEGSLNPCCAYYGFDSVFGQVLTGPIIGVKLGGLRTVLEINGNG